MKITAAQQAPDNKEEAIRSSINEIQFRPYPYPNTCQQSSCFAKQYPSPVLIELALVVYVRSCLSTGT